MEHQDWNTTKWQKPLSVVKKDDKKHENPPGTSLFRKLDSGEPEPLPVLNVDIRVKIQQGRLAKNMTQKQLANAINVQPNIISDYESGKTIPDNKVLSKISKALGIKCSLK